MKSCQDRTAEWPRNHVIKSRNLSHCIQVDSFYWFYSYRTETLQSFNSIPDHPFSCQKFSLMFPSQTFLGSFIETAGTLLGVRREAERLSRRTDDLVLAGSWRPRKVPNGQWHGQGRNTVISEWSVRATPADRPTSANTSRGTLSQDRAATSEQEIIFSD